MSLQLPNIADSVAAVGRDSAPLGRVMERRLTVILSADVAGYSALMERDEARTLTRLKATWNSVLEPRLTAYGARVVKMMGDGALIEFSSVVSAVACANEIQEALTHAELDLPEADRIRFRIGINLGEVIVEGEDIFGDGVNVAARLQALAAPGAIVVSSAVRDQVTGKLEVTFADLGEHMLKNLERPVRIFAIGDAGLAMLPPQNRNHQTRVAISVLPFVNMSGDPEQEYFSDGVTEDIITDLSKISSLSVSSRNSTFAYKGQITDLAKVARKLGVSHVLEGSVRKAGNQVRITAQLVDAAANDHIWAERYDRDLSDIFAVQDEISGAIVAALRLKLLPEEKRALEARATSNPEAYKLYLMARQYNATGNERHQEIVLRLCRRALEFDTNYARAWAMMSLSLTELHRRSANDDDGWDAAERALALDPKLADAHAARGSVLCNRGLFEEALAACEQALQLDPDLYEANKHAGRCCLGAQRFPDAIGYFEHAATAMPTDFYTPAMTMQAYEALGDKNGAQGAARRVLERIEKIIAQEPDHGRAMGYGVCALATLNEVERAKEWAARAMLLDPDNSNLKYNLACAMSNLGETDVALAILEDVTPILSAGTIIWMDKDTDLDPIRGHPRFCALLRQASARLTQQ